MPDSSAMPGEGGSPPTPPRGGWPLWLRIGLAAVVVAFVWSPFLAMVARLSHVAPSLQPTGGTPDLVPAPARTPSASTPPSRP